MWCDHIAYIRYSSDCHVDGTAVDHPSEPLDRTGSLLKWPPRMRDTVSRWHATELEDTEGIMPHRILTTYYT